MRRAEEEAPVSSFYRLSSIGKMAARWSKNTSFDFNIDQSLAQRYERFATKLIYRQGTPIM
jgi:hypothetical protein